MTVKTPIAPDTNVGDIMDHLMTLDNEGDAKAFYDEIIKWAMLPEVQAYTNETLSREQVIERAQRNIGYWSGYSVRLRKWLGLS